MREIKFRAWVKYTKQMHQVEEIRLCTEPYMQLKLAGESPITSFRVGDNVELMQFTGLKDAKGVEIYEDDILAFDEMGHPIVGYVKRFGAMWIIEDASTLNLNTDSKILSVIGNRHEHPELLEVK